MFLDFKYLVLFVILSIPITVAFCAGKPNTTPTKPPSVPFTRSAVIALADSNIAAREVKLTEKNQSSVNELKQRLKNLQTLPASQAKLVNETVNLLTFNLAKMKSLNTIIVASAYLVKAQPDNPRTTNLLATALHCDKKLDDAVALLEYAHGIDKQSTLIILNLANVYMDLNNIEKAKLLLDDVVKKEPENRDAYRALALYWYKKNNKIKTDEMMRKAAGINGMIRKASRKHEEEIRKEEVTATDSLEVTSGKIDKLKNQIPLTTADIIMDDYPAEAQQIREKYSKMLSSERMRLPKLPQGRTSSNKDYTDNKPIFMEWIRIFGDNLKDFMAQEKYKGMIPNGDNDAAIEAKGKEISREKLREALDTAKKQLAMVKNMPGIDKSQLKVAEIEIAKLEKQYKLDSKIKTTEEDANPEDLPGWDNGGLFCRANYSDYLIISRSYEQYIRKFFENYNATENDIIKVYQKKQHELQKAHDAQMENINKTHEAVIRAGTGKTIHDGKDEPCVRERIRCIREMNSLSNEYYKQWVNLYMPQYTQKMKPMLEDYWYVEALYIRNMNDHKVVEREYLRVKESYLMFAMDAAKHLAYGEIFKYNAATEAEAQEMEALLAKAEEEAPDEGKKFKNDSATASGDWMKWIEDHLSLDISAEFLSLKVTPRSFEFNAWAFGPGAGIKMDMVDEKMETYTGVGAKFELGIKVAGVGLKAEGKGDIARKWTKWDFQNGTYEEGYSAKAEGSMGVGATSVSGEIEIDPQLNAKGSASINAAIGNITYTNQVASFGDD